MDCRIQIILKVIEEKGLLVALTPEEASRLLGLSETRVRRLFHREVGTTFGRYIRQKRLAHASALLQDCALPIKQIASNCGYEDVCNFYRDFRQTYGITPRNLRMRNVNAHLLDLGTSHGELRPLLTLQK